MCLLFHAYEYRNHLCVCGGGGFGISLHVFFFFILNQGFSRFTAFSYFYIRVQPLTSELEF